ncbi:MAG: FAD-dependent oxidoreductase [Acidibacillus sp.]|uniref:Sulfide-quinone reductase n=1 Tax=Sulfoacidibacillus ferrooxidans TaxID=2005001 RepID=A0A9X2AB95_9BACL|nr:FAD-dependent oxidoreductase [Sulfoacidibacillus ferrooxidans]MCI0182469.1 Sulfide-quinone reductase [Sulfoacidibacillus ferrooxidans]MCY0892333.1 FAD-dependent oxidoreductase [Acidibacillus sp.]
MHQIVILGSGFGGMTVFHHLATWASSHDVHITVIDERETFLLKPSLPEVALGEKSVRDVVFPLRKVIESYGKFIRGRVHRIDAKAQRVYLEDAAVVAYDTLIIALGGKKDFSSIEGFTEYGYSMCTDILAPQLYTAIENFKGGDVVLGSAPMVQGTRTPDVPFLEAACEGPLGEIAFMIDVELRKRGLREQSTITCFSPAEIFFDDVGDKVHEAFGALAKKHEVGVVTKKTIDHLEVDKVMFTDGSSLPSALTVLIPSYRGADVIVESELGDEVGFVPTDENFRHLDYPNIFAIGDGAARTVPKLGHLAVAQGDTVASIIRAEITGSGKITSYEPEIFCIMNMGKRKAMLIRSNTLYGGTMDIAYYGAISSYMKTAFDDFLLRFKGKMPPEIMQKWLNLYLGRLQE